MFVSSSIWLFVSLLGYVTLLGCSFLYCFFATYKNDKGMEGCCVGSLFVVGVLLYRVGV